MDAEASAVYEEFLAASEAYITEAVDELTEELKGHGETV